MYRVSVFLFIYFSFAAQAGDTMTVVAGMNKPPYVIQKDNSGFEIELVRTVINGMGKSANFMYVDYGRSSKLLYTEGIDAVMTTNNRVFVDPSILSDPYIRYRNVAITLAENNFQIDNISDLSKFSIVSFQLANKVLGKDFAEAAQNSPMFIQMGIQSRQPEMLFKKRAEVVVMDKQIFYTFLSQTSWRDQADRIKIHYIFPASSYSMAFKDKQNVSLFNAALKTFLASNEYIQLQHKYGFK